MSGPRDGDAPVGGEPVDREPVDGGPSSEPVDVPSWATGPVGPAPHPRADKAVVLGLLSLVGGFFLLPLLLGPYAWWYGASVRREVDREPDRWTPRSRRSASVGALLGLAATVVLTILVLVVVGLAVSAHLSLTEDTGY